MLEFLYEIPCPACRYTTPLLETSLSQIVRLRRLSGTGEPFVVLVCQGCKVAFRYDYQHRATSALISEGPKTEELQSHTYFSVVAPCDRHDKDECDDSLLELTAIRAVGTTTRDLVEREMPGWDLSGLRCKNGHPIVHPDPTKAYEHSDTDQPDE